MEYIEGTPLKGPLPVDQALKYAAQICDALDTAHKKGITHRDLKPANILVTKAIGQLLPHRRTGERRSCMREPATVM
jgi:serine/threonine protein kinase